MPLGFELDESRSLVWTTADGLVGDEDIRKHLRALAETHAKSPYARELVDLRNIVLGEVTSEAVRDAANIVGSNPGLGSVKIAFVASEDVVFGLSRMFEMLQTEHAGEIRVFRNLPAAEEWLGID